MFMTHRLGLGLMDLIVLLLSSTLRIYGGPLELESMNQSYCFMVMIQIKQAGSQNLHDPSSDPSSKPTMTLTLLSTTLFRSALRPKSPRSPDMRCIMIIYFLYTGGMSAPFLVRCHSSYYVTRGGGSKGMSGTMAQVWILNPHSNLGHRYYAQVHVVQDEDQCYAQVHGGLEVDSLMGFTLLKLIQGQEIIQIHKSRLCTRLTKYYDL